MTASWTPGSSSSPSIRTGLPPASSKCARAGSIAVSRDSSPSIWSRTGSLVVEVVIAPAYLAADRGYSDGTTMPLAILSPHLDDAVLSCWHVLEGPEQARVINVFTADPPPGTPPPWWDRLTGASDPRRANARADHGVRARGTRRAP